jgi:hypothetical protein
MEASETDARLAEILADPAGADLAEVRRLAESSPAVAAALLERLASALLEAEPARAGRWLTEAAALWAGAGGDPRRAARSLRTAITVAPEDDEALTRLIHLYCDNGKHRSLARILERRAEALAERGAPDPAAARRVADAFTALGHLLREEPLASPVEAIAAYSRAIATGAASAEPFRAARALYVNAGQLADALPLFAQERAQCAEAAQRIDRYREEVTVRKLAGDGPGASELLRRARLDEPEAGLEGDLARSILDRLDAGERVPAGECAEGAEVFAAQATEASWLAAERCFAGAGRWEDAAWAAERREDFGRALALLAHAAPEDADARLRLALRAVHLHAHGLRDERLAQARCEALLPELRPGLDAAAIERLLGEGRGEAGTAASVAARLEEAALRAGDHAALKIAFELGARALAGAARAAELVRQADALIGLGALPSLAVRRAEGGLDGLPPAEAAPLLDRLARLLPAEDAVDPYDRWLAGVAAGGDLVPALEIALPPALDRCPAPRLGSFLEALVARAAPPAALDAIEAIVAAGDGRRGDPALTTALAAALSRAEPPARPGAPTRSALLRRAARLARRLGDADQAFEWLGDALFARLEVALAELAGPLQGHAAELRRVEGELRALAEREALAARPPTARPPAAPPPTARPPAARPPAAPPPAARPPTARPPPPPRLPTLSLELRDPFPSPPTGRPSEPAPSRRSSGEELIADLFLVMHRLDFCKDSLEGAAFVLELCATELGSCGGMVHLYDIDRREFVIVRAAGPGAASLRGLRTADGEPLVDEVMRTRGALLARESDPRVVGRRWEILRASAPAPLTAVACARVAQAGRYLGLIELASVAAGGFAAGDEHALAYVAERFTALVAERGVLFGDEG